MLRDVTEEYALRMRIVSMSLIHNQLYRTGLYSEIDMEQYVTTLAEELLNAYWWPGSVSIKVTIRGRKLGLQTVIPCGLILNELISNSLKYAFRGREDGTIVIFIMFT